MLRICSAFCGVSLLVSPLAVQAAPAARTVQLSKVVLDTETSEAIARVKGGTLCVFPSNVKLPKEKKTQDYERFDHLFSDRMKSGGFTVVSTSNDMFADADDKKKADVLVGVTLRPVVINLCSSVKGQKGDMSVTAEWQIFDRTTGKVVETVTTNGRGLQEKFATDGLDQMVNSAFADSVGTLISQGVVQKYVQAAGAQ